MGSNNAPSNSLPSLSRRAQFSEDLASSNQRNLNDGQLQKVLQHHGYTDLTRLSSRVFSAQHSSWGLVTIKYAQQLKHRHFLKQEAEFLYSNTKFKTDYNRKDIWPNYCDYFSSHQSDCLVLSYIDGQTLLDIQTNSKTTQPLLYRWLTALEKVINQVHTLGFVHGDIKPSNIICSPQGQARLIDYGSVTKIGTERSVLRFDSYTPRYSRHQSVTNTLDDWFALAVILEELLDAGVLPSRYQVLLKQHR
ncbi:protein kinase family protein [Vibrio sp. Scap24]|nr:protein kinase family protein [Vibrio sp. Scap16]QLE91707.1 protein kinase family protein [Vibrio sp. Scap24]